MAAKRKTSASVAVGQGVIGFGLLTVGVVGATGTVLGFFGSTWWLFDFAANFRPHLAVVLLLVALAYALLFSKATGVFFVAMAAINAAVVLPLYLNTQEPAINDESMTIVSFNVEQRSSIRDLTFRWVDSLDADLVVLLDSTNDWAHSGEMTNVYTLESQIPIDRTFGITILSQEGLDTELLRTTQVRDSVVRVEASIGDEPIAIYAVQARSSSNETDAGNRDAYLAEVGRMVGEETIPAIIVGDFQATPWSHAFRDLTADTGFKNSLDSYGLQTTWPADRWAFFRMPLDHLLHSEALTTVDRYLGPVLGVDHRPIVVTVGLAS